MNNGSWNIFKTKLITSGNRAKSILLIIAVMTIMAIGSPSFAATYYMATTGSNSNAGTSSAPWLTLAYSFSRMSGGDTLIIKNGTYTGTNNTISSSVYPPVGASSSNYTVVRAENDGGVILPGMDFNHYGSSPAQYLQFEGLIFHGQVQVRGLSYIKFLRCGAYDGGSGDAQNWMIMWYNVDGTESSYILLEGCYAYGTGRYKFATYHANHIIFRSCVGRMDGENAGGEPIAIYAAYNSDYVKFQNCIAIDSDQTAYWSSIGDRQGCFFVPTTDGGSNYVDVDQSVGMNVKCGGLEVARNNPTTNINFRNVVLWDCADAGDWMLATRNPATVSNLTMYGSSASENYCDGSSTGFQNCLFWNNTITTFWGDAPTSQNYCYWYGNSNTPSTRGSNSQTTINPSTSILYPVRIESGSPLKGAGLNGADIGANCMTLIGTPGTLWGDSGYATDTGTSMWPFPNEDLIRSKLAAYSNGGVSGARGFCTGTSRDGSAQTLTKYIWEYLGNQIPSNIYGTQEQDLTAPAEPSGVQVQIIN